jgi:hypothetical protein
MLMSRHETAEHHDTEWFNIAFHTFEDVLYDHQQVKYLNTHWSGNVSIFIYSPLNSYVLQIYWTVQSAHVSKHVQPSRSRYFVVAIARGLSTMRRKWFRHNHHRCTFIWLWKLNYWKAQVITTTASWLRSWVMYQYNVSVCSRDL